MTIIHKLSIDLAQRESPAQIDAVQDDCGRSLSLLLHVNGIPWPIPSNVRATIRYCKSDGIGGEYDTLPDGTCAWSALDNMLTIALAPQVLTTAGTTVLSVLLSDGSKNVSTFDILLQVQPGIHSRTTLSDTYVNVSSVNVSSPEDIGARIMGGKIRSIVLLGDSITDGAGGSGYNGSHSGKVSTNTEGYCWANAFKKFVEQRYGIPVQNMGMYGTVMSNQKNEALKFITQNDFVIWLTGTNDRWDVDSYKTNLRTHLAAIKERCAGMLVISNIPATQADENQRPVTMQKMDEIIMSELAGFVPHFSMYQAMTQYCEQQSILLSDCFADHCHPNDLGYFIMFKLLCQKLGIPLDPYTDYQSSGLWWNPITEVQHTLTTSIGFITEDQCKSVAINTNVVPLVMMHHYNGNNRTTAFSGKHITDIDLYVMTAGVITVGTVDLNTCGLSKPTYLRSIKVTVSQKGFINVPLGWDLGENETLTLQDPTDTGKLGFVLTSSPMITWQASDYLAGTLSANITVHGNVHMKGVAAGGNAATLGTVLLDGSDDIPNPSENIILSSSVVPVILMSDYDSTAHTTAVSGKHITGVAMHVKSTGTVTISKVDLTTIGQTPIFTESKTFIATQTGEEIVFRLNIDVGPNETLAFQCTQDTGMLGFNVSTGDLFIWKSSAFAAGAKDADLILRGKIYYK